MRRDLSTFADSTYALLVIGAGIHGACIAWVLRERLASQAKAYVQQEFTPEAAQRKLNSFYTMIESKASGAGV